MAAYRYSKRITQRIEAAIIYNHKTYILEVVRTKW
jgi:hypothetical protein